MSPRLASSPDEALWLNTYGSGTSATNLGGMTREWISIVTETSLYVQGLTVKNEHFMKAWNAWYRQDCRRAAGSHMRNGASIRTAWPQMWALCATLK